MRNQNQHYGGRNFGRGEQNRGQFSGNRFSSGYSNRETTRGNQQPGSRHETNENRRYQDHDSEGYFLNRYDQYADYDQGSQSDDSWKWQDRGEECRFAGYGNQQSDIYRPGWDQKAYDTDLNYGSGQTDYDNSGGGVALRINRGARTRREAIAILPRAGVYRIMMMTICIGAMNRSANWMKTTTVGSPSAARNFLRILTSGVLIA